MKEKKIFGRIDINYINQHYKIKFLVLSLIFLVANLKRVLSRFV